MAQVNSLYPAGLVSSRGTAAPPYTAGPYSWSEDLTIAGHFARSPERYYLEEFWKTGTPALIAAWAYGYNYNFGVIGTNMTTALSTLSPTGGIVLTTAGAAADQAMLWPAVAKNTPWLDASWLTTATAQVIWEASIKMDAVITNTIVWAGLKLTATAAAAGPAVGTDNDAAWFRFSSVDSDTTWHLITSRSGTDTNTASAVTVVASAIYRFKIWIDGSRSPHFSINDSEVYVGLPLTSAISLIPVIGLNAVNAAAHAITVHYEKISRLAI